MAAPRGLLEDHVGYWLRLVSNSVSHAFQLKLERRGVTVAEWVVMRSLFDRQATRPSELADELGMSRGAVSKLADRLLAKRLVKSRRDADDGRVQTLHLTPAGRKLVPSLIALADRNDEEFFGSLSKAQRTELMNLLQDVARRNEIRNVPVD